MIELKTGKKSALLVDVRQSGDDERLSALSFEELKSLSETADLLVKNGIIVTVRTVNPATFIGSGKVEEIATMIKEEEIEVVVFNMALSPRVQRNLEAAWNIPAIDREEIILQIFADRAQTKEAKLQVRLARLEYTRPRLTRMWTQLSQQRGGAYGAKGEGETQLELDQRIIDEKILQLKKELKTVDKERTMQRQSRLQSPIPRAAIVGYTNVGKSTLLNKLAGSSVLVEDKLFATLDPTTRQVKLPGGEQILLTDTVGFVSNLPTHLVDSFKSTLQEASYADFLIILADASHPDMLDCYTTTLQVLDDLGCNGKDAIVFVNKIDKAHDEISIAKLKSLSDHVIVGSVTTGTGLDTLLTAIADEIHKLTPLFTYCLPEDRYDLLSRVRREAQVVNVDYTGNGIVVSVRVKNPSLARELLPFVQQP